MARDTRTELAENGDKVRVQPGEPLEESGPRAPSPRSVALVGAACTLTGGMLWGLSGTCSKILMGAWDIQPLWLVCVRQAAAGLLLLAMALVRNPHVVSDLVRRRRDVAQLLASAFVGMFLNSCCYLYAVDLTDSGTATILQSLSIPLVLVYVCLRTRRAPRRREVAGLVLALAGVYLVATHGDLGALHISPAGLLFGLGCATGAAAVSVLSRRLLAEYGSMAIVGMEMVLVGGCLSIVVRPWESVPAFDAGGWGLLAFTVVAGTVFAYGLFFQGVKNLGAYKANLLGTIEPVTATVASVLLTGTSFVPAELAGFAAILVMVFLTS
ncbi:DMT family transporter [Atopobiaceae bacterium 24-176]